jgi:hypothetical protein
MAFNAKKRAEMPLGMVVASASEPLTGSAAQNLDLGLASARAAAVLRRIIAGIEVDDIDRAVLQTAEELMTVTADAADFVAAGGQLSRTRGHFSFSAVALTMELAAPSAPPTDVAKRLRAFATTLSTLRGDATVADALSVLPAFSALADIATRHAGSVGEGGGSLA